MIGQSNMAGRGIRTEVEPIKNPNIFVLRNGRWCPMYVPVNPDRPKAGISLAESFADDYQKKYGRRVGLIPCADGGTCLDQWMPGEVLFDNAVFQASLAMRTSSLAGILWHQGEGDCTDERYPLYFEKCSYIMTELRSRLGLPELPILLGGLGDFLPSRPGNPEYRLENYVHVNAALIRMAKELPLCGFASAEGLGSNPDLLHFSSVALREFGHRYFAALESLGEIKVTETDIATDTKMSSMERL